MKVNLAALVMGFCLLASTGVRAESDSDLAKQLANPIASLISVPFQFNRDEGIGPGGNGTRSWVNFQPVIPFSLNDSWNVISRTIIPFVDQRDVIPGTSASGVGDIVQSFFFSPKQPTSGGLIWGVGPVFLLPSATNAQLGLDQFAAGITGVALKQSGPWTYGALANHLWDVGGHGVTDISATYFQPFVSYTTPNAWTFSLNSEATYDWVLDEANVPLNLTVTKLVKIAGQPVSVGGGVRYYADSPANGADGWGARLIMTFLFPR